MREKEYEREHIVIRREITRDPSAPYHSFFPRGTSYFFTSKHLVCMLLEGARRRGRGSAPANLSTFYEFVCVLILLPAREKEERGMHR